MTWWDWRAGLPQALGWLLLSHMMLASRATHGPPIQSSPSASKCLLSTYYVWLMEKSAKQEGLPGGQGGRPLSGWVAVHSASVRLWSPRGLMGMWDKD